MLKKILSVLLCMAMVIGCITLPALADTETTWGIDNLNNEDGEIKVAFLGGSITYGGAANPRVENRYSTLVVNEFFKTRFPNKTVTEINAGISGTPTEYGVFRVADHIGKYAPDVVFVEFAVNDTGYAITENGKREVRSNMEGIVRRLLALPKIPTIIFLYTHDVNDKNEPAISVNLDDSIAEHQKIAEHYGIASINLHQHIVDEEAKGNFVWYNRENPSDTNALSNDATHPNNNGHREYADYIISKFNENYSEYLKKPQTGRPHYERGYIFQNPDIVNHDDENVEYTGNWIKSDDEGGMTNSAVSVPEPIKTNWALSKTPGDKAVFTFMGRSIGISYGYNMTKGGIMRLTVDAGTENEFSRDITLIPTSGEGYSVAHFLMSRHLEYGEHTITVENVSTDATNCYIGFAHFLTDDAEPQLVTGAVGENDDYIPAGIRPANLIVQPNSSPVYTASNTNAVKFTAGEVPGTMQYTFKGIDGEGKFYYGTYFPIEGTYVGSVGNNDYNKNSFNGYLPDGPTSYVMEFYASNTSPDGITPVMSAGLRATNSGAGDTEFFSTEVTQRGKWQKIKGVVDLDCENPTDLKMMIGFATSTIPEFETSFQVYTGASYVAEEKEFDITHTVKGGKNLVAPGTLVETEARVVNQIELPGKLSQNFTYKVLNADRTEEADCITLASSSNGTASFEVAKDAPFGDYIILAKSTDYEGFQKGVKITVADIPDYSDYEKPQTRTDNLIASRASSALYTGGNTTAVGYSVPASDFYTMRYTFVGDTFQHGVYYPVEGTHTNATNVNGFNGYFPTKNTNYVVEIQLKNVEPTVDANPEFAMTMFTDKTKAVVRRFNVTQTDSWQTFATTIPVEATASTTATSFLLEMGFGPKGKTPVKGTVIDFNKNAFYIAEEKAFDISHSANGTVRVAPGKTIATTAQVVNQIGTPGELSQDFTYKVLNADRTAEVDCITLTSSENGNAVFTVADDAPFGDYIILATSSQYAGFRKGLKVTVADIPDYSDYVAPETRPDNLITSRATSSLYTGRNSTAVDISVPASDFYTTRFTFGEDTFQHNGYYPVEGVHANATNVNGFNGYFPTKNTNYVVEIQLKNVEPTVDANPEFAVTMFTDKTKAVVRRFNVTQTDSWQTFKTTIPVEATASTTATSFLLQMGFGPKGKTPVKGTVIDFNKNAFYIAEEVAFGISANAVSSNKVEQGGTIDLEAAVLNQSGLKGYLEQDFTWIALNADRTETVSGITFASNEDGKVTATVAPTVAEGTYVILAKSAYKGIQKGVTIEVTAPELVTELTIDTSVAGTASLSAKVVNSTANKIMFIIASYNGSKLSESKKDEIFVVDGQAVIEGLQIRVNAGDRIRAFIWDSNGLRPIKLRDDLVYEK